MLPSNLATAKKAYLRKLSLAACLLLARSVMAQSTCKLLLEFNDVVITQGLGERSSTERKGMGDLSLMGGAEVFIDVTGGLDKNAQLNTITVKCKQTGLAKYALMSQSHRRCLL